MNIKEETAKPDFVYAQCGLNKNVMEIGHSMKICDGMENPSDCIEKQDVFFSTGGDFVPCNLTEGTKFLGCSKSVVKRNGISYSVIATSNQKIRRIV